MLSAGFGPATATVQVKASFREDQGAADTGQAVVQGKQWEGRESKERERHG